MFINLFADVSESYKNVTHEIPRKTILIFKFILNKLVKGELFMS